MNKNRSINQRDFRNNLNGYVLGYDIGYYTCVNWEWIGLDLYEDFLPLFGDDEIYEVCTTTQVVACDADVHADVHAAYTFA